MELPGSRYSDQPDPGRREPVPVSRPPSATEVSLRKPPGNGSDGGAIANGHAHAQGVASSLVEIPGVPIKLTRKFGRYRIIKRLGRGAMGSVYLAHDTHLDRRVALKVPHFPSAGSTSANQPNRREVDRFYREARTAATFNHPNLCPVFDVGQIDGIHYLSMAYIKGQPLSDFIDHRKPMPPERIAGIVRRLALALESAHNRGVVHRDLKPSNIMINSRRELIIMDFGLAWRVGSSDERLTKTGMVLGTPAYMSPEQLSGSAEALGPRCDVYSLGVIMYELLTGCRPFVGQEAVILGQILFIEPVPPSGHRPDLDPQIEAICLKAMAKRPEERFGSMGELVAALTDYLRGSSASAPPPPASSAAASPADEAHSREPASDQEEEGGAEAVQDFDSGCAGGCGPELETILPSDASEPATGEVPATLEEYWRHWTGVVEIFALRRSRRHVDWQEYHEVHQGLIESCRARALEAAEPKRSFYRHLEDLALPWLTPKILAQVDQEILFSLLLCCRRAEQELGSERPEPEEHGDRAALYAALVWGASGFLALTIVAWVASLVFTGF
jgi:serine/threonine protein kinase